MQLLATYVLIVGFVALLIIGLFSVCRDLLARDIFPAASSAYDEQPLEIANDAGRSGLDADLNSRDAREPAERF